MFSLTLSALGIVVPVRLDLFTSFGGQFSIDTHGSTASTSFTSPTPQFDFESRIELVGVVAVAVQNAAADGALDVQIIDPRRAHGKLTHANLDADASSVGIVCPNDPTRRANCPGSLTCTNQFGEEYEMTC
jgi:hypothetical protein